MQRFVVSSQRQVNGQPLPHKSQPLAGGLLTLRQCQRDIAQEGSLARAGVAQHDQPRLFTQHVFDPQPLRPFGPLTQRGLVHHLAWLNKPGTGRGHS